MDFDFLANDPRIRICLPLYVYTYCTDFPQPKTIYENGAPNHHFILTLSGEGVFKINGKSKTLKQGDLIFYKKGIPCSYSPITEDWHTCFISFNGNSADKLLSYYGFGDANLFNDDFLSEMLLNICRSADKSINEEKLSELLYGFINETGSSILNIFRPKPLVKALRHINNNYTNPSLTINEIVEVSGTSTTKLFKMFKQMENTSPAQYVTNIRMNHAKNLLLTTNYMVNDVAKTVGYETANYFSSAFRHHVGMSPLTFRKKYFGRTLSDVNNELRKGPSDEELLKIIRECGTYEKIKSYLKEKYNLNMNDTL
jgi:AraC-like DNA-binding protein